MNRLLIDLELPRIMRDQKQHMRKLPRDKRCLLVSLFITGCSIITVKGFCVSVSLTSKPALGMQLSTWNQLLIWQRNSETGEKFALEETMPEEAIQLYTDVITILEEDGGGQMAFDLYRSATAVYIKLEKYLDAAPLQLKFGLAASKCNATNSQCKAYLSAIIIYLYTNDYKQEEMCYNDCSQIDAFCKSDQNRCASNLLAAYSDGDIEEIKRIAQSSSISNLDHSMIRLARKLPTGDVSALKGNTARQEDQPLDENDLT
ncbi:hypothetical protein AHAS_Ahas02G0100700 [Arachis hypogaea]